MPNSSLHEKSSSATWPESINPPKNWPSRQHTHPISNAILPIACPAGGQQGLNSFQHSTVGSDAHQNQPPPTAQPACLAHRHQHGQGQDTKHHTVCPLVSPQTQPPGIQVHASPGRKVQRGNEERECHGGDGMAYTRPEGRSWIPLPMQHRTRLNRCAPRSLLRSTTHRFPKRIPPEPG